jgi:hypothetical protein
MIRKLGKFHEYARKHRLTRFIPKAFRDNCHDKESSMEIVMMGRILSMNYVEV